MIDTRQLPAPAKRELIAETSDGTDSDYCGGLPVCALRESFVDVYGSRPKMWCDRFIQLNRFGALWLTSVLIASVLGTQICAVPSSYGQELLPAPSNPGVPFTLVRPETLDTLHSPLLRNDLQINGAQSCAVSNCHGGPRPGVSQPWARRGMEYQLWVENDPHARSWRTICGDESVAIMRRLGIMDGDRIVDRAGFDNCLACHNTVKRYDEPRTSRRVADFARLTSQSSSPRASHSVADANTFLREGVGCAGCHGPSEKWASTHFQYFWSPQGATDQGFVEAGDLFVRARMCASCHVGDKDRDMNHDIIAAGHPALRYELATFHAWQPKHWRDSESNDKTFYEAQLWLAGQVAATDASLALLESRTAEAHSVSQWPEFAAYDCASCHHNLGLKNDRRPLTDSRRATAIYSQWNDAGLRWVIEYRRDNGQSTSLDDQLLAALDRVKTEMEQRPEPDRQAAAKAVLEARKTLAQWVRGAPGVHERHVMRSDRLGKVVASAAGHPSTFQTWESAVQFYLAAVAARESWPKGWNGPLRPLADRMQRGLRYPEMIDVSRYATRDYSAPTANRMETMELGLELAGWLGPVTLHPDAIVEPETAPEEIESRLNQLIDEINARWKQQRQSDQTQRGDTRPDAQPEQAQPPRQRRSIEELMQQRNQQPDQP